MIDVTALIAGTVFAPQFARHWRAASAIGSNDNSGGMTAAKRARPSGGHPSGDELQPAVNLEDLPSDVARRGGAEESHGLRHILGQPGPAERNTLDDALARLSWHRRRCLRLDE